METKSRFEAVVRALNELKDTKKASAAELAARFGMKKTQFYTLLKGEYVRPKTGNRNFSDQVINKLYNEVAIKQKPVSIASYTFLESTARKCQNDGSMACCTGIPGLGKSTALKHFSETWQSTYYILCNHLDDALSFIAKIHRALGLKPVGIKSSKKARLVMIDEITEHVAGQEVRPLLLLDDIHHLGVSVYQDLKLIFDKTFGLMGVVLVGTEILERQLKRWAGYTIDWEAKYKPRNIMPELVSRFRDNFHPITPLRDVDLIAICERHGVASQARKIAKHFIRLPHLDLRMFTEKVVKASEVANANGAVVSLELMLSL